MKWLTKHFLTLSIVLSIVLGGFAVFATQTQAQTSGEKINRFSSDIKINTDASINVVETIVYDFGNQQKHGIYRDIPVTYDTNLGNTSIQLKNISVHDESFNRYTFSTSREGRNLRIKIGDADTLISGVHTYVISYQVRRAINYFDSYDELYWNVTGNDWIVPIEQTTANVSFEKSVDKTDLQSACYYGYVGSSNRCTQSDLRFSAPQILEPHEGLTIAVGFPKGIVTKPTSLQNALQFLKDNWILGLPILVFIGMFYHWYKKGRDPKSKNPIVPEYESPENLSPVEISGLLRGGVDSKSVTAQIVSLAIRGYIKITKAEKRKLLGFKEDDYILTKQKDLPADAEEWDKKLMIGLFGTDTVVNISDLKNVFYSKIPRIEEVTMDSLIAKGYFPKNPNTVRNIYIFLAFGVFLVGVFIAGGLEINNGAYYISLFVSAIIIFVFAFLMSKVTPLGADIKKRIKGLKMYIGVAEKDRIDFHNAPEKNPELFEKLLPFAMVLGLEEKWAKQFESIYTTQPSWYNDPTHTGFNALLLSNNLTAFNKTASAALASAPGGSSGSGGGGSSGGGFGGGGGGSW